MGVKLSNWAGNTVFSAARLHQPTSLEQLQDLIVRGRKLKVLGSRHSFNDIADAEDLISLEKLGQTVVIDQTQQRVTVNANITYGQLCQQLHRAGFALHNMASLPHITVAGACATATHGSGDNNGNLATAVTHGRCGHAVTRPRRRRICRRRGRVGRPGGCHQNDPRHCSPLHDAAGSV
jgi:FAD/FMN-containing dehydrogenase